MTGKQVTMLASVVYVFLAITVMYALIVMYRGLDCMMRDDVIS